MAEYCPFFGVSVMRMAPDLPSILGVLRAMDDDRCGLITSIASPCAMKMDGVPVAWGACPRNPENVHQSFFADRGLAKAGPAALAYGEYPGEYPPLPPDDDEDEAA
jgi:hypothetical protein